MTPIRPAAALLALAALAACEDVPDAPSRPSFATLDARLSAIEDRTADLDILDPAFLPVTGSASYEGVIEMRTGGGGGAPTDMRGELGLDVSFATDDVTGQATNFVTDGEERLDGTLDVDGDLDRLSDPTREGAIDATLAGTLTDGDGDRFAVAAGMEGDFLGGDFDTDPEAVAGTVVGTFGSTPLVGEFVAD